MKPELKEHFSRDSGARSVRLQSKVIQEQVDKPIRIDKSKLIYSQQINITNCDSFEQLSHEFMRWWTITENNSENTGNEHIKSLRRMKDHPLFPVNWFDLPGQIEQIINQLLYLDRVQYSEIREKLDNPTYGRHQIDNFLKAIDAFGRSNNIQGLRKVITPYLHLKEKPGPKLPNIPPPPVVNKLIHYQYTTDKIINSEIKTILNLGFHVGARPSELIRMKLSYVNGRRNKVRKREDKVGNPENWVDVDQDVLHGHQQPSVITNWINIHRRRLLERLGISEEQDEGWLFPDPNTGKRFLGSRNLYNFLCRRVKPVLKQLYPEDDYDFYPKIMRTWCGISTLIRTKVENKKWDIREVKYRLGHDDESDVTEDYVKQAKSLYMEHPYDWFRAVLKFHPTSKRMTSLLKEYNRPKPKKIAQKSINAKNTSVSCGTTGEVLSAPVGIRTRVAGSKGQNDWPDYTTGANETGLMQMGKQIFLFNFSPHNRTLF